jgi:ElaB/YqjD/DUF883 family membrane-anchored ribosome-binding protein
VAEERSSMTSRPVHSVPAAADAKTAEADDTREIREQIARTREGMGRTIDELQERLSPQHVMQQAKDSIHEATVGRVKEVVSTASDTVRDTAAHVAERAQDTASRIADEVRSHPVTTALIGAGIVGLVRGTSMFRHRAQGDDFYTDGPTQYRTASYQGERDMANGYGQNGWTNVLREHPVPMALAAISIGYLLTQRSGGGRARDEWRWNRDATRRAGTWDRQHRMQEQTRGHGDPVYAAASEAREAVGSTADDIGEKVSEWGDQIKEGARRVGAQARESAGEFTEGVQERWQTVRRRTSSEFEEWMDENPLAVGAAALAAGIALGFTTPRTRFEDEHMGATRDALVNRTSEAAEAAAEDVTERLQNAAETLVGDASSDASSSSSRQDGSKEASTTSGQAGRTSGSGPVL